MNHLGVLLHGETRVAPTFTAEDILLLVLGSELDFVVLRHAVLSLWCLLCDPCNWDIDVTVLKQWNIRAVLGAF